MQSVSRQQTSEEFSRVDDVEISTEISKYNYIVHAQYMYIHVHSKHKDKCKIC